MWTYEIKPSNTKIRALRKFKTQIWRGTLWTLRWVIPKIWEKVFTNFLHTWYCLSNSQCYKITYLLQFCQILSNLVKIAFSKIFWPLGITKWQNKHEFEPELPKNGNSSLYFICAQFSAEGFIKMNYPISIYRIVDSR